MLLCRAAGQQDHRWQSDYEQIGGERNGERERQSMASPAASQGAQYLGLGQLLDVILRAVEADGVSPKLVQVSPSAFHPCRPCIPLTSCK